MRAGVVELRPRHGERAVVEALADEPVVVLTGARQAGKTTLARQIVERMRGTFLSLDDADILDAARSDPAWLLDGRSEPIVIDEFQRAPDVLLAIKTRVDRQRRAGRFLLTGSTRFLTLPTISESLAGRVAIIELWPFSQGELLGTRERFVDALFERPRALSAGRFSQSPPDYLERALAGGFPVALARHAGRSRSRWFRGYVTTVTQRDVLDIARVRRAAELAKLLRLAAARTATVLNATTLATDAGLPPATAHEYLALLEVVFLLHRLPAWSTNLTSKVAKHPKLHLTDTGLGGHLLGLDARGARALSPAARGPLLESFVVNELCKQLGWSDIDAELFHFRDRGGAEVDAVLETRDGRVAAVEVKAGTRVDADDLHGLELLRDRLGERFVQGVVLYSGTIPQRRTDRILVLPMEALWRTTVGRRAENRAKPPA